MPKRLDKTVLRATATARRATRSQTAVSVSSCKTPPPAVAPTAADETKPPVNHGLGAVDITTLTTTTASNPATSSTAASARPPSSEQPPTLFFPSAEAWSSWLALNGASTPRGIWLRLAKKASGVASVGYDEAVDAALCHGWIDGQRRRCAGDDDDTPAARFFFLQRFTPRRPRSVWSRRNVAKVRALIDAGRMAPAGMLEADAARVDGRWERAY